MNEEILSRAFYGLSLIFHNFFANLPLGFSLLTFILTLLYVILKKEELKISYVISFKIFCFSVLLSIISGLIYNLEFSPLWEKFDFSLAEWKANIGHFSAIISFFISSALILSILKFRVYDNKVIFLFLSTCLIFLAWLFSGWGIFLNTVMQNPSGLTLKSGVLEISGKLGELFFSKHHFFRQLHIILGSFLKAIFMLLLFLNIVNYANFKLLYKKLLFLGVLVLIGIFLSGHYQLHNISKSQPIKFSTIEGINDFEDTSTWKLFGVMDLSGKPYHIPVNLNVVKILDVKPTFLKQIPIEEKPNPFIVFNSFRTMFFSGFALLFLLVYFGVINKPVKISQIVVILLLLEISIISGWIVSEVGRQPWTIYGLLKTEVSNEFENFKLYFIQTLISSILIVSISAIGFNKMIKYLRDKSI